MLAKILITAFNVILVVALGWFGATIAIFLHMPWAAALWVLLLLVIAFFDIRKAWRGGYN